MASRRTWSTSPDPLGPLIRLAAVGDIHVGMDSAGVHRPHWLNIRQQADVFLLAGNLTRHGEPEEAAVLASELEDLGVPIVAVLGNYDYESDCQDDIRRLMEDAGVTVLESESTSSPIQPFSPSQPLLAGPTTWTAPPGAQPVPSGVELLGQIVRLADVGDEL